ncbi:hypothetical protein A2U01_0064595 [Trifolium medium]|uniref:Tf2-1-like SH3-like domain-containing protein n=1 Tax=Trifolium medium TaxID=97028 RepID=A0A392S3C8_9FABA|nr:hypothetical protein [Trifolium medium]
MSQKLATRYYGPYKVIRNIGSVAYELDLPPSTRIHPVVHISLLHPYYGDNPSEHFTPIPNDSSFKPFSEEQEDCILNKEEFSVVETKRQKV